MWGLSGLSCIQRALDTQTQEASPSKLPHGCQEGLQAKGTQGLSRCHPAPGPEWTEQNQKRLHQSPQGRMQPDGFSEGNSEGAGRTGSFLLESGRSAGPPQAAGLLVLVEQGHAGEGAGAGPALVLLHLRVGLQVGAQVGAVGEGAVAVGAGEGLLTWGQRDPGGEAWRQGHSLMPSLHLPPLEPLTGP